MTYQYEQDPPVWAAGCRRVQPLAGRLLQRGARAARRCRARHRRRRRRDRARGGEPARPWHLRRHPAPEQRWRAIRSTTTRVTSRCGPRARRTRLPVHTHTGWTPNYGDFTGSLGIFITEITWFAHRSFWLLAWSGAFERHPDLRMVMTEQGATWVPTRWRRWIRRTRCRCSGTCAASCRCRRRSTSRVSATSASFLGPEEAAARYDIGVDKLMWGSDYPHIEGTWPHTEAKLKEGFADMPRDEALRVVGENAIGGVRVRPHRWPRSRPRSARRADLLGNQGFSR